MKTKIPNFMEKEVALHAYVPGPSAYHTAKDWNKNIPGTIGQFMKCKKYNCFAIIFCIDKLIWVR